MNDRNFSSNADEIRFYVKQLLNDYKDHNCKEINDFIRKTPNGYKFTGGMITGAIKTLVDTERDNYKNVRRGWYRAIRPVAITGTHNICKGEIKAESVESLFTKRINGILEETKSKLNDACTINLLNLTDTDSKLTQIKKVSAIIKYINQFQEEF